MEAMAEARITASKAYEDYQSGYRKEILRLLARLRTRQQEIKTFRGA